MKIDKDPLHTANQHDFRRQCVHSHEFRLLLSQCLRLGLRLLLCKLLPTFSLVTPFVSIVIMGAVLVFLKREQIEES